MVEMVRQGKSQRAAARRFRFTLHTVQRWLARAKGLELATADWSGRSHVAHTVANKTPADVEEKICALREELESSAALGFSGAQSIHEALQGSEDPVAKPSVRTIGRILRRKGFLDRPRRIRNAAPPAGWYLSGLAGRSADLDCFDVIEDLRMDGFGLLQVFTARTLWAPLAEA